MLLTHGMAVLDAIKMYFPSDCVNDDTFQRSCARLVRSWTNLVSPPGSMTQTSTLNLSS